MTHPFEVCQEQGHVWHFVEQLKPIPDDDIPEDLRNSPLRARDVAAAKWVCDRCSLNGIQPYRIQDGRTAPDRFLDPAHQEGIVIYVDDDDDEEWDEDD